MSSDWTLSATQLVSSSLASLASHIEDLVSFPTSHCLYVIFQLSFFFGSETAWIATNLFFLLLHFVPPLLCQATKFRCWTFVFIWCLPIFLRIPWVTFISLWHFSKMTVWIKTGISQFVRSDHQITVSKFYQNRSARKQFISENRFLDPVRLTTSYFGS